MNYNPPKKILVTTDENILELVGKEKINKEECYRYKFTKSLTKLNMTFTMTEKELNKNLRNFFKIIDHENN